jgi:peptidoglycan/LPS O-acetylase OafA/YrhL
VHDSGAKPRYFSVTDRIGRLPELDGLRGIAILLVLFRHTVRPIIEQHGSLLRVGSWDLATPLLNGWMGVDLFFVLSGFLITHHLLNRWPARFNRTFMLRYWIKRLLRTFPAYVAAVLIALSSVIPFFEVNAKSTSHTLAIHLLFLQDYFGSDLVAAFWSLGVEEKFYLLCPLVLFYVSRLTPRRKLIALTVLALLPTLLRVATLAGSHAQYLNYPAFFWTIRSPFHLAMDGLWIGVICAVIYANKELRESIRVLNVRRIANISLVVLIVSISSVAWFDGGWYYASTIVLAVIALAFGGLLLSSILGQSWISEALRSVWLRAMSTISYSVYLMHLMFVPLALDLVRRFFPAFEAQAGLHFLAFTPVFLALSVAAGLALHFTVEKPFLILKDKIRL